MRTKLLTSLLISGVFFSLMGCKPQEEPADSPTAVTGPTKATTEAAPPTSTETAALPETLSGDLTIFVPCGMNGPFGKAKTLFEAAYPDVKLHPRVENIDVILTKLTETEETADCLISIGDREMIFLADEGKLDGDPTNLAQNGIAILVPTGNPGGIATLADFASDAVKTIAIADPARMSAGYYAKQALENAGVWADIEAKVITTQAPAELKVLCAQKQVEAAITYATCMKEAKEEGGEPTAPKKAEGVAEVPQDLYDVFYCTGAVIAGTENPEAARAFIQFMLKPEVQEAFVEYGLKPIEN